MVSVILAVVANSFNPGESIVVDAKDVSVMVSQIHVKTIPRTRTVYVIRDLAFK